MLDSSQLDIQRFRKIEGLIYTTEIECLLYLSF